MKTRDFRLVQLSALIVAAAISLWTAGAWAFEVDPSSPVAEGLKHADAGIAAILAVPDAGATWRALDLPLEARSVIVSGDNLAIGGVENGRTEAWFEVRADGSVARLGGPPRPHRPGRLA